MVKPFPAIIKVLATVVLLAVPLTIVEAADRDDSPVGSGGNWLIKVLPGQDPEAVAAAAGGLYVGPLKEVDGYHRIRFLQELVSKPDGGSWKDQVYLQLEAQPAITAFEEEVLIVSYPRVFEPTDPLFPDQWHHENIGQSGGVPFADARVRAAWDRGFNGAGTTIAIVDEGTQYRHPDLQSNWVVGSGYDYNDDDSDPSPSGFDDRHGTAVAGITLAASNATGGLGIAYEANLVPLRLIAGPYESGEEAEALSYRKQEVDIYNNSWGPSDNFGVRYADSSGVLKDALETNTRIGRGGLGNIYVWAAGNGGLNGDNSNYDGYNSLPYTISVGAMGHDNVKAGYSEPGANLLVVAPSGGRGSGIVTSDNTGFSGYDSGDNYDNFSGTSAASPMVAGVVSLMLDARPDLSWRDVQQILALTASPVDFENGGWEKNAVGLWVNHDYGFGRVDADAATQLALEWPLLGTMLSRSGQQLIRKSLLTGVSQEGGITIAGTFETQFVRVTLRLDHSDWGDIRVELVSPSGTSSILAEVHANANASGSPGTWTYLSTRHLGEPVDGEWKLIVTDDSTGGTGSWTSWAIEVMGHDVSGRNNAFPVGDDLFIESTTFPVEVNLLDGMEDPDGDVLKVLVVQHPQAGSLISLGEGTYSFTMGETKGGRDSFSVLVSDSNGGVKRRLVEVLDPRPVAANDFYPIGAGRTVDLPVLSNDQDPDGDQLRLVSVAGAYSGNATILENQSIRFDAPDDLAGVLRLQYILTDDSDGEVNGWITLVVQETPDIAIQFDGVDDYLFLPPTPGVGLSDNFTTEAWIYPESFGEYVTGFGRIFDRDTFIFFLNGFDHAFYNDRSLVLYMITTDGRAFAINSSPSTIRLDRWQHVAVTYNSSDSLQPVRMYVDGNQVGVTYPTEVSTSRPNRPINTTPLAPLYIGESDSGARAFKGRMSEFRIWNRVLPATTIAAQQDLRMTGSELGLQYYLPLDQTQEPIAVSTGSFKGTTDIVEAQRVPLTLPWAEFERHYAILDDFENGWWLDRTLGEVFGDNFPWVYLPSLNWAYTGHEPGSSVYFLFPAGNNWGWLQTAESIYPWFYQVNEGRWLWYLEGTMDPAWFYDTSASGWLSSLEGISAL